MKITTPAAKTVRRAVIEQPNPRVRAELKPNETKRAGEVQAFESGSGADRAAVEASTRQLLSALGTTDAGAMKRLLARGRIDVQIPSFGFKLADASKVDGPLKALRAAFPDLSVTATRIQVDPERNRSAAEYELRGTFQGPLGPLQPTGEQVAMKALAITQFDADGKVVYQKHHLDVAGALHQLGYLPDPETKGGRLKLIAKKSLGTAISIAASGLVSNLGKVFRRERVPQVEFVKPSDPSPEAVVRRHFAAENAHDVAGTLQTMSPGKIVHASNGTGETRETRDQVYAYYQEAFRAFPDSTFELKNLVVDPVRREAAMEYHFRGTHEGPVSGLPPTGKPVEYDGMIVFDIDQQGGVAKERSFIGVLDVLAAMGLSHDPKTPEGLRQLIEK